MLLATPFDAVVWWPASALHRDCWTPQADCSGTYQVRMVFKDDGGGLAKGGDVSLYLEAKAGWP